MPAARLHVVGLREFVRDLKRVDRALGKAVSTANQRAAQIVVDAAEARAAGQPTATRKLAEGKALRAAKQQRAAAVILNAGLQGTGWAMGAEFGSKRYRRFQAYNAEGYALFPACDDPTVLARVEEAYLQLMADQLDPIFPG